MTYYNTAAIILVVLLDLIILNLVWRALKGPNRLTELSAAVVSFSLIAVGVVMTMLTLSTAVEAAKLTHAIPGKYKSHTTSVMHYKMKSTHPQYKKHRYRNKKVWGQPSRRATLPVKMKWNDIRRPIIMSNIIPIVYLIFAGIWFAVHYTLCRMEDKD